MDPSFSVDTHYVTPNPIFVPSPNSQPNRTKRTANDRTKVHQADDLHDQLEGNFETASGVERQYSDDYFHGIPVSSFFVHPLAKNDDAPSADQLVSAEYGVDNQTPVSSIPALLSDVEKNPIAACHPWTTSETLDSVRRFHASPQPLVDDLDSTTRPDQPGPESHLTRDNAFSTEAGLVTGNGFAWPELVLQLVNDPRGAIDSLGQAVLHLLGHGENRIGITSTRFGEGCSTIAASLALWASNFDQSVLLVDGHFNRPRLAQQLGIKVAEPWTVSSHDPDSIEERIHHLGGTSVGMLPLATEGAVMDSPEQAFDVLGRSLRTISEQYDLVVIDIGPVFQLMTELEISTHLMDVAILASAVNRTSIVERSRSQEILTSLGTQKMVVAENFAQRTWLETGGKL
ncbi:MAG: hypothetical protein MK108_01050 [Mariniblastus sp.]|nr:hypothetical protein [Mariniblastus sp.]